MTRSTYHQPDCFDALTNPRKHMTPDEVAGFQMQFNVNLNDEDDWFDSEADELEGLEVIGEEEFVQRYVLGADLFD